jgi:hypothetical protein
MPLSKSFLGDDRHSRAPVQSSSGRLWVERDEARNVAAGYFERSPEGKNGADRRWQPGPTSQYPSDAAALIFYIPDFVSLTNTGTEQVLTPQFR